MGDFDDRIATLSEQRRLALQDISEIDKGVTHKWNGKGTTLKRKMRALKIAADLEVIIAAYESHNDEATS